MDPVSQTVLGATIGAAFSPRLGERAVWVGACSGALPDVDVFFTIGDPWAMLVYHRQATHSLFVLTLLAPLAGYGMHRWLKTANAWQWTHMVWWASITHTLLDWCTPYGTQLFWPLTNARYACDAVSVVDPLYTLPLLLATVLQFRSKSPPAVRWRWAVGTLLLTTSYLVLGYWQSHRALDWARPQLAASRIEYDRLRATPTLLNLWLRRIEAADDQRNVCVGFVSTWNLQPTQFHCLRWPDEPLVDRALASERGEIFRWFSDDLLSAEVEQRGTDTVVRFSDQRYGMIDAPTQSIFRAEARFNSTGELQEFVRLPSPDRSDMRGQLTLLWRWIVDGRP